MADKQDHFYLPPPPQSFLPIANDDRVFPVNRVFCIGRNYADHAVEMGVDPEKEPPVFFMKPVGAIMCDQAVLSAMPFPLQTQNLHYEVEMLVALGKAGTHIHKDDAWDHIAGYGIALDMTRRDLQNEAKVHGRPWDMAKGFDQSCPCGALYLADQIGHMRAGRIALQLNGICKQESDLSAMIWPVDAVIAALSQLMHLQAGDVILTGTPSGVGAVQPGDHMQASIDRLGALDIIYQDEHRP